MIKKIVYILIFTGLLSTSLSARWINDDPLIELVIGSQFSHSYLSNEIGLTYNIFGVSDDEHDYSFFNEPDPINIDWISYVVMNLKKHNAEKITYLNTGLFIGTKWLWFDPYVGLEASFAKIEHDTFFLFDQKRLYFNMVLGFRLIKIEDPGIHFDLEYSLIGEKKENSSLDFLGVAGIKVYLALL